MKKHNNKNGFTLVEVIVVAVLLMVLALGVYSLFIMYLGSAHETSANLKMQRQSDGLTDDISRKVRASDIILPLPPAPTGYPYTMTDITNGTSAHAVLRAFLVSVNAPTNPYDPAVLANDTVSGVVFYNVANPTFITGNMVGDSIVGGFRFQSGGVHEFVKTNHRTWEWKPYSTDGSQTQYCTMTGTDHSHVNSAGATILRHLNSFILSRSRVEVKMDVNLYTFSNKWYHINTRRGEFRCRVVWID